ncbi:hypothetical protein JAAARDRAFT_30149 [Jaapia argillacea MUCL 33604]|uniref:Phosphogluconate dehydrogenase NAD-binding putative C-terminal domain-containing protein n=1 Tax=Jaapia argillacea MUCL 33604 TaxID=933084 RepID=A0A067QFG6_9AGAM|nr:hypothetical protein JAAARDRAFT_30149 [Jaapia argillacea MUCL 33604]
MSITSLPRIAVVAAGAMGAAVGHQLTKAGCTVFTNLDGRSEATRRRARDAGMQDVPLSHLASQSNWVLSILPPSDAYSFAERFLEEYQRSKGTRASQKETDVTLCYADCNAVNPETVKTIAGLFAGTGIKFVDAGIIGGPPREGYKPTFYASSDPSDTGVLEEFVELNQYGLKIVPLKGEGAGVGDASALKMSYAGISKGITGLCTTMILAAHASSPATAEALMQELSISQPIILKRITTSIPDMLPKAYRWVGEMEEISAFVGSGEGAIHKGMASIYARVEKSLEGDGGDVDVLKDFVDKARGGIDRK